MTVQKKIKLGDLESVEVINLLAEHHRDMLQHSPVESVHALDLSGLKVSNVTFWTVWIEAENKQQLAGCGALKELDNNHAEIKSMRTSAQFLRQGVAEYLLSHLIDQAKQRNYSQLSLETGTAKAFAPAQKLYQKFGFSECPPFADYQLDPYSLFMTKQI